MIAIHDLGNLHVSVSAELVIPNRPVEITFHYIDAQDYTQASSYLGRHHFKDFEGIYWFTSDGGLTQIYIFFVLPPYCTLRTLGQHCLWCVE